MLIYSATDEHLRLFLISCLSKNAMKISWCLKMFKCETASYMVPFQNIRACTRIQLSIKIVLTFHTSQQEYFKYKCLYLFAIAVPFPTTACSNAQL